MKSNVIVKVCSPVEFLKQNGKKDVGFIRIEYRNNEELSIVGEVKTKKGKWICGGQCIETIRGGSPVSGWTKEMVDRLCDIWDRWHLNTMRPYCDHQKELGWVEKAHEQVILYTYTLKSGIYWKIDKIKKRLVELAKNGEEVALNDEDKKMLSLEYEIVTPEKLSEEMLQYYALKNPLYPADNSFETAKELGWLREDEHPEGILGKKCPVCGHAYGGAWQKEEVPKDVLDWLFALPDAKTHSELWQ